MSWFSLRRLRALLSKEIIQMRRDRVTFAMMLGVPLMQLLLFGYAINRKMEVIHNGTVAYMSLLESEMRRFQFQPGDSEGFVNYPLTIKSMKLSAIFVATHKFIRVSLRSRGGVDVDLFARKYFNGGGHRNAAGGKSFMTMRETIEHFKRSVAEFAAQGGLD